MLARAVAAADMPVADLVLDADELELIDDLLPEPAFGPSSAAMTGAALLPMSGSKLISIRVPNKVINAFKELAGRSGSRYQSLMNRTLNTAVRGFA